MSRLTLSSPAFDSNSDTNTPFDLHRCLPIVQHSSSQVQPPDLRYYPGGLARTDMVLIEGMTLYTEDMLRGPLFR
jgi:hypothetical protein